MSKLKLKTNSKGQIGVMALLLVAVIIGSVFLVGGIIPGKSKINPDGGSYIPITDNPKDSQNTLQLKTIKFRSCGSTAAVDFLVDRSGSMQFGTKMTNLKTALNTFGNSFPEDGLISMQSFSDYPVLNVPFDYFKNVGNLFIGSVNSLFPFGATHTKDAFVFAKSQLDGARSNFPGRNLTLVFISDGIPETGQANASCPGGKGEDSRYCEENPRSPGACRCFDVNQDPTPVASEIKKSGVRIFTIGYIHDEDNKFKADLTDLMKRVASSPDDFYQAPISNQLTDILQSISTKICKDEI